MILTTRHLSSSRGRAGQRGTLLRCRFGAPGTRWRPSGCGASTSPSPATTRSRWPTASSACTRRSRPAPSLSLAARVPGLTVDDVRAAVAVRRSLVKAWGLRKTLHLFAPAQLPVVLAALRTSSLYRDAYLRPAWLRYHKVTLDEMQAIVAHVGEALDGRALTRDELASELRRITGSDAVGEAVRSGWGAVLKPAAFRGELCFGPDRGRNVTFVRPDQWLPAWARRE